MDVLGHNIVLPFRGSEHPATERFDGGDEADVRKSILMLENVTIRGKEDEERDREFMFHLGGSALDLYYETFKRDGSVTDEAKRY